MVQYRTKKASYPKCAVTGQRLAGIKALRPSEYSNKRMSKRQKSVNRIYGGCLSHKVVRERIMRAFLVEEQKIVKKVCSVIAHVYLMHTSSVPWQYSHAVVGPHDTSRQYSSSQLLSPQLCSGQQRCSSKSDCRAMWDITGTWVCAATEW